MDEEGTEDRSDDDEEEEDDDDVLNLHSIFISRASERASKASEKLAGGPTWIGLKNF